MEYSRVASSFALSSFSLLDVQSAGRVLMATTACETLSGLEGQAVTRHVRDKERGIIGIIPSPANRPVNFCLEADQDEEALYARLELGLVEGPAPSCLRR